MNQARKNFQLSKVPIAKAEMLIRKPGKFSYTWVWDDADGNPMRESLVSVELNPVGNKTEMTFTHSGFTSEDEKESHEGGWSSALNKLERLLKDGNYESK